MTIQINGVELPEHVSYSSFTTWLECGFKYYLSRVVETPGQASWWLVGGSAVHTASEVYDRAFEGLVSE
jgi:hypothetical protein